MKRFNLLLLAFVAALLCSCKPDNPKPVEPSGFHLGSGVFVLNEGNYLASNASLSFYDPEADTVCNNLFYKANNAPLGDVAQSLAMADGQLFIVVNNGNYIYKVDANTMLCDTTKPFKLGSFYSPREMHIVAPNKAYVSDLVGSQLWIIDPQDFKHCGTVEMGKTTEKMVQVGNELYVSNWSYYYVDPYSHDSYNTVQVVDMNNDVKVAEIEVGKEPNSMVVDRNGHVWVLCEGRSWEDEYGENPTLWEIDPMLKTTERRYEFKGPYEFDDDIKGTASSLKINLSGSMLYMIYNNEVRLFDISTQRLSDEFCITAPEGGLFYNMAVDPKSGTLYIADAKSYTREGVVYRYSEDGVLLGSFQVGLIPSAMLFK